MTLFDTVEDMTEMTERLRIIGWIVREGIDSQPGMSYSEASRRWPMSLATLNRLMNGEAVSLRYWRNAEINLGLPRYLLDKVLDGDMAWIRTVEGLDVHTRKSILEMLGETTPEASTRTKRKA